VRRVSARRLAELGYGVVEAQDSAAALEALERAGEIDLLFTDVVMPGRMNGIELAQEIRRRRPGVKILLTSGFAAPETVDQARRLDGAAWLRKPYSTANLRERLEALLRG
jgi:CheY-like chemotaxis protein